MGKYNDIQRDLAALNGFQYIDLDRLLPKTLEVFIDDCHFTLHGSRRVADAVLPTLRDLVSARIDKLFKTGKFRGL